MSLAQLWVKVARLLKSGQHHGPSVCWVEVGWDGSPPSPKPHILRGSRIGDGKNKKLMSKIYAIVLSQSHGDVWEAQLSTLPNLKYGWIWHPSGWQWRGTYTCLLWCEESATITPDEQEHLSVLSCINAISESIPNFYIFKGKQFRHNTSSIVRLKLVGPCNQRHEWPFSFSPNECHISLHVRNWKEATCHGHIAIFW